jgi:protein-disulfide isomerase
VALAGGFKLGGTGDVVPPDTSYIGLPIDGAVVGSSSAPVVMTVYSDFQCPACRLFVTTELPSLLRDFVRPGLVRIESTDINILDHGGTESLDLAAGAACATEQDRYWLYHDLVFWNQGRENRGDHDAAFVRRMADAAGVDRTAFDACYARSDIRPPIRARTAASATTGVTATPTLVINGQTIVGVPDYSKLSALLRSLITPSPSLAAPS